MWCLHFYYNILNVFLNFILEFHKLSLLNFIRLGFFYTCLSCGFFHFLFRCCFHISLCLLNKKVYHFKTTFFFFYKARAHWHRKRMEDTSTKLRCLTDSSHCQVLINIIKKREKNTKKLGGHKPNPVIHTKVKVDPSGKYKK